MFGLLFIKSSSFWVTSYWSDTHAKLSSIKSIIDDKFMLRLWSFTCSEFPRQQMPILGFLVFTKCDFQLLICFMSACSEYGIDFVFLKTLMEGSSEDNGNQSRER